MILGGVVVLGGGYWMYSHSNTPSGPAPATNVTHVGRDAAPNATVTTSPTDPAASSHDASQTGAPSSTTTNNS